MAKQHQWAERNATRQAYYGMPGLYKGEWKKPQMFPYGPEPSDFDTYGQYFWFYAGWYIIWLSTIAAAVIIILDLVLYVNHEGDPDKRVLALSIVPSVTVLIWMTIDGILRKKTWQRGRLGVEGVVVVGTIVCLALLGTMAGAKTRQGDTFAHWYSGLSGVLGDLL
ncbi:hypothetical protein J7T55_000364 [Diaporthe amygdali]|uniref:uncharacterized protein n=1 Tax=Phomopsis amygdali TaxID=1214568 RepID=UPI0022FF3B9C|nr:uncharacterized protein J7T55_000364 [Diaporthe amygdali]KAJ0109439.1 hypothetical protein J7T55_000364 [Diaporthe amygdali]